MDNLPHAHRQFLHLQNGYSSLSSACSFGRSYEGSQENQVQALIMTHNQPHNDWREPMRKIPAPKGVHVGMMVLSRKVAWIGFSSVSHITYQAGSPHLPAVKHNCRWGLLWGTQVISAWTWKCTPRQAAPRHGPPPMQVHTPASPPLALQTPCYRRLCPKPPPPTQPELPKDKTCFSVKVEAVTRIMK